MEFNFDNVICNVKGEYKELYYDITKEFHSLPNYIRSIKVRIDDFIFLNQEITQEYAKSAFECFVQHNKIENNRVQCDGEEIIIEFVDDFSIHATSSEWSLIFFGMRKESEKHVTFISYVL